MKPVGGQRVAASNRKKSKIDNGTIAKPGTRKPKSSDKANYTRLTGGGSTTTFLKTAMPRNDEKGTSCFNLLRPCPKPPLHPETHSGTGLFQDAYESPTQKQGIAFKRASKLALQFFPMNDIIRKEMEKGQLNPHLELLVGMKKKISSVIKHLNTKWSNSIVAYGKLILFPIGAQIGNLSSFKRWTTEDIGVTVGDIYSDLGSPSIFQLRYGWFSDINECDKENQNVCTLENQNVCNVKNQNMLKTNMSLEKEGGTNALFSDLTNMSFTELLSSIKQTTSMEGGSCLPFYSDSFDAAIASHVARFKVPISSNLPPNTSILDAEETCQAFSFQKKIITAKETSASVGSYNANEESIHDGRIALSNQEPLSDKMSKLADGQTLSNSDQNLAKAISCVISEANEAKPNLTSTEQHHLCQGSQNPSEALPTASEKSLGLFGVNCDSLDFGISLASAWKQMVGDESTSFSNLFEIGCSRDASRRNITIPQNSEHSRDAVDILTQ